jgi:hypothetical protein
VRSFIISRAIRTCYVVEEACQLAGGFMAFVQFISKSGLEGRKLFFSKKLKGKVVPVLNKLSTTI